MENLNTAKYSITDRYGFTNGMDFICFVDRCTLFLLMVESKKDRCTGKQRKKEGKEGEGGKEEAEEIRSRYSSIIIITKTYIC